MVRVLLEPGADVNAKLGACDAVTLAKTRNHDNLAMLIVRFKKQHGGQWQADVWLSHENENSR